MPQLWVTDGSRAGTEPVSAFTKDQAPRFSDPEAISNAPTVVELGSRTLFVAATAPANLDQLWAAGGSSNLPVKLADRLTGLPSSPITLGGRMLYTVSAQAAPTITLWSTDGTSSGSLLLARDVLAGATVAGGAAFFAALDGNSIELWRSDGTPAGTHPFTDPAAQAENFDVGSLAALGGELLFPADGPYGRELWRSNGAPGGTQLVTDIDHNEFSANPAALTAFGGQLLFSAFDAISRQLWQSAGTAASTSALTSLPPLNGDSPDSWPQQLVAAGGRIYFWQQVAIGDPYDLWRNDGTAAGTVLLHEFSDLGLGSGPAPSPTPLGGRIFFSAPRDGGGTSLWASDGTPAGTAVAVDLPDLSTPLANLSAAGGKLFFAASGPAPGFQARLYTSDGTPAGTAVLLAGSFQVAAPMQLTTVGASAFFIVTRDESNQELWKTDGTPAGTVFIASLFVGGNEPQPSDLIAFGGALYFFADTSTGRSFFRSDGTPQGTVQVQSFAQDNSLSNNLVVLGDALFFAASDSEHGRELWKSDGTAAGTAMLLDIAPGAASSNPSWLVAAGGRLWFSADDGLHGVELWQSDGTAAGSRMVQDIASGLESSFPDQLTPVGNLLYFTADDGSLGRELWAVPLSPAGAGCQPTSTRLCLTGNRFQVDVVWRDFQGNQGMGTAVPLTADTGYFWFFTSANVELIVKVLDARALNQSFWVFYGALSDVEYTITVTDTATGLTQQYFNPAGQLASVGDTTAFGPLGEFSAPPVAQAQAFRAESAPPARAARTAAAAAFPAGATPLAARTAAAASACQGNPAGLCLNGSRFAVTAAWTDFQGHSGTGTAVALSGDTGYFWFFDPDNVEVVLKVIDGRPVNGKFWVFYGALSSVQYSLTVTDTQTGEVRTYQNPSGQLACVADTNAF